MIALRHLSCALVALTGCLLSSCATQDERAAYAPATGRLGGAALGASIGSFSGRAGPGAAIGLLVGGIGGDLYRGHDRANRVIDPMGTVKAAPATIREASRRQTYLKNRVPTLGMRIATDKASGNTNSLLVNKSEAARNEGESRMWERRMQDTSKALEMAAQGRLPVPDGDYASLSRNRTYADGLKYAFGDLAKEFKRLSR